MSETIGRTFSAITLRSGLRRVVSTAAPPGDRPHVRIAVFDGERRLHRIFIRHGAELALVEKAFAAVADPDLEGSRLIGEIGTHGPIEFVVLAQAHPRRDPAVVFGRRRVDTGQLVGSATTIAGAELESLRAACAWVRDNAAASTEDP